MKIFIIAALTADGFIGRTADELADWSSTEDKRLFARLTKEAGVMVMGRTTFETIGRALPGRRTIVYTNHPETLNVEGIETTIEPPAALVARLQTENTPGLAVCGGAQVYTQFIQAGVVDELYITISPLLFGRGIGLFTMPLETKLELLEASPLSHQEQLLHYGVHK